MTKLQEYAAQLQEAVEKSLPPEVSATNLRFYAKLIEMDELDARHVEALDKSVFIASLQSYAAAMDETRTTLRNLVPPLLEEIGKQGWISVEDRLPELRTSVLVWCPERKNRYTAFVDNIDGGIRWYHFAVAHREMFETVTHWMSMDSLPKTPEITSSSPSSASAPSGHTQGQPEQTTSEREREIRERLQKASKAPWWKAGIYTALRFFSKNYCGDVWDERPQEVIDAESMPQYGNDADIELITKAPSDIEFLLAQLDAARGALDRTLANFKRLLEMKPVRDAAETIAEAERVLKEGK